MIHPVHGGESEGWETHLRAMYKLRADVFSTRLDWQVNVVGGLERDRFDDEDPLYLISLSDDGFLEGSVRVLPTTGPNMLEDVFGVLLGQHGSVRSPVIWEASRFCVATHRIKDLNYRLQRRTTSQLLAALVEVGMEAGLQSIVAVCDERFRRVLRIAGWPIEVLGTPQVIGKVKAYAGLLPTNQEALQSIREIGGFEDSVLSKEMPIARSAA